MNLKSAGILATKLVSKAKYLTKAKSPELLLAAGIVAGVASIVTAIIETPKAQEVLEEHKEQMEMVHEASTNPEYADKYNEDDAKKDTFIIYTKTGFKLLKTYAIPILLEVVAIACLLGSHNIVTKRNAALAAAYAVVDKSFKDYRGRVVDRFGEDVDYQLKNDIRAEKIEVEETDPETGKTKTVKKKADVMDLNSQDIYVRIFDRKNPNWSDDQRYVENFASMMATVMSDQVIARHVLPFNDALGEWGFEKIYPVGQYVGWKDKGGKRGQVSIKVRPIYYTGSDGRFADAYAFEFNLDGYIFDMPKKAA